MVQPVSIYYRQERAVKAHRDARPAVKCTYTETKAKQQQQQRDSLDSVAETAASLEAILPVRLTELYYPILWVPGCKNEGDTDVLEDLCNLRARSGGALRPDTTGSP